MTAESISIKKYISRILDATTPLVKSDLEQLTSLGKDELKYLDEHWNKGDIKRRRQIMSNLFDLSQKHLALDFRPIFVFGLDDPDAKIRERSVAGLADEEDASLIGVLTRMLHKDSSADVRTASAAALGKLALQGELGKIPAAKTDAVYNALLETLDSKSEKTAVKTSALEAIATLNMPRVKGLIERAYHSTELEYKISAIKAMGLNCNRMWLTALLEEIKNSNDAIRYAAVKALGELGEEDAVLYLMELVEDPNPKIQEAAIESLGEIGGDEAKQLLTMLTSNSQQRIRHAAKLALQELEFCEDPLSTNF